MEPVCKTCNDTHQMWFGDEGESRKVMCTRCPLPCPDCAVGPGFGPFCAKTPCPCKCHRNDGAR